MKIAIAVFFAIACLGLRAVVVTVGYAPAIYWWTMHCVTLPIFFLALCTVSKKTTGMLGAGYVVFTVVSIFVFEYFLGK